MQELQLAQQLKDEQHLSEGERAIEQVHRGTGIVRGSSTTSESTSGNLEQALKLHAQKDIRVEEKSSRGLKESVLDFGQAHKKGQNHQPQVGKENDAVVQDSGGLDVSAMPRACLKN